MQNPHPRAYAELGALLDARDDIHHNKPPVVKLRDVLPDLSAPQVRNRLPNPAMERFSVADTARKLDEVDICNID